MNPISYPIRTLLAPSPDYRWGVHLCLLAPLGAIMAFVILCLGWWGEPVRQFFSASDSRYSHYPLHERRYPYRQSAHLCVLSCVTACCSHQAGLAGNNVRSALRFVQRLLFVLRHADHEIRAGYAETGISLASIPFGLYQSICFVPFRAYGDYHHRSRASGTLVQKPSFFPFTLGSNRAHGFFPSVVGAASPHRYCWRNAFREYCRQVHCLRAAPDGKRRAAGAWRTKNTRRNG